jgi:8-amino-7-oxononanoate synthase
MSEDFLHKKLNERKGQNAFRTLRLANNRIDFCSNDYLGIVKNNLLKFDQTGLKHGSTGSRLLSGNYTLIEETEKFIANFHEAQAGLIFNSGYDANIGLLASVPQKGDLIMYDQLIHASIRDGIRLSFAQSFSFRHNDPVDLETRLQKKVATGNVFVVTESVFSMDGDTAPLVEISLLCEKYSAHLIVDEAHATGVIGKKGEGLVQQMNLQNKCFARVHTFGKACGVHGAIVLGSGDLRNYLINFARPFIYSTALPEVNVAAIKAAYTIFPSLNNERENLKRLIKQFQNQKLSSLPVGMRTPIQIVIIPGTEYVKKAAENCRQNNFDVRAILYPTVPKESERLRIVLHAFNAIEQIDHLLNILLN